MKTKHGHRVTPELQNDVSKGQNLFVSFVIPATEHREMKVDCTTILFIMSQNGVNLIASSGSFLINGRFYGTNKI